MGARQNSQWWFMNASPPPVENLAAGHFTVTPFFGNWSIPRPPRNIHE
jgi:hypothetical protein